MRRRPRGGRVAAALGSVLVLAGAGLGAATTWAHAPVVTTDVRVVARDFSYDGGQGTLMDYRQQESGPLVGGALEIWPLSLMQVGFGSGLSIYGKVGFGVTHQVVQERQMDGTIVPLYTGFAVLGFCALLAVFAVEGRSGLFRGE